MVTKVITRLDRLRTQCLTMLSGVVITRLAEVITRLSGVVIESVPRFFL